ncbi:vWA domain-containing protein [Pyrobaculum aerophilum]|uniref:Phage head-tail adapter protein n=1 Tax=Pyrobaculum aerophilum TaxID=13773 RepID=A0A371R6N7_9CREN|nr:vWA domain-containing protein [Pyrobaculum aerophilum]RFA97280.1 phage head-tail adapter protein [Pyrobaculum aerophilum]RFB00134.1 phage head-tail adapter protein [Pyrobaculum aerophilum]
MNDLVELILTLSDCLDGVSLRSLIYAVADVYARSHLGEVDENKLLEIIAQNLAGFLGVTPSEAKRIVEAGILCASTYAKEAPMSLPTGSIGDEKAPTLAHLVNKHVPVDATPRVKLNVIKRLGLPAEAIEEFKNKISARGEGLISVKSAVRGVKRYHPNASIADIDMIRTAASITRKSIQGKAISDDDFYLHEYTYVIDKPVYVALDVSGSMKEYMGRATKLRVAKAVIARYLRQMASLRGSVSLVLFNVNADFLWTPHPAHRYLREMLEILRYVYAMGGTELASALELLHYYGARGDVVIISDGRTSDSEKVLQLSRRFKRIHVVATEKSQLLRQIAKITGGKYRELTLTVDLLSLHM